MISAHFGRRTRSFDYDYQSIINAFNLFHGYFWLQLFVSIYNDIVLENYFINKLDDRNEYFLT